MRLNRTPLMRWCGALIFCLFMSGSTRLAIGAPATNVVVATQDTFIQLQNPALNYGAASSLVVNRETIGLERALVQFDLSSIPTNAVIVNATLKMQATQAGNMSIGVYGILKPWSEGVGNGSAAPANWTQSAAGTNWSSAGGDFDATAVATLNVTGTGPHSWNLTPLVQAWVNRTRPNYGVMLSSPDGGGNRTVTYESREGATRPALVISYTSPLAIMVQPQSQTVAPGTTVALNVVAAGTNLQYRWLRNGIPIPGAAQSTLTLSNATPRDGGSYSVVVSSGSESMRSSQAIVQVTSPALPFADNFPGAGSITTLSGQGSGNNMTASVENVEPWHDGVRSSRSIWLTWVAPASGVTTFDALGSDFDTVVAIYTGSQLGTLTPVVSDDDGGGYASSRVMFNAQAGVAYRIAVGSRDPASAGHVVLTWNVQTSAPLLPLSISLPPPRSVLPGLSTILAVNLDLSLETLLGYQWYYGDAPIFAAITPTLLVASVTPDTVGTYRLQMNNRAWTLPTRPIEVQINTEGNGTAIARKKLSDAILTPLVGVRASESPQIATTEATTTDPTATTTTKTPRTRTNAAASRSKAPTAEPAIAQSGTPLASGYSGTQVFKTYPGKDPSEPDACGVEGGASYWFTYSPPESGTLRLSTDGSTFDTVLAIYVDDGRNLGYQSLVELACDNNGGTNGRTSTLVVPVTGGVSYYIMVDGVNGASGRVNLSYRLDTLPKLSPIPDQEISENTTSAPIAFVIRDAESAPDSLLLRASCADSNLVAGNGFTFSGAGTNRTMLIAPVANRFGTNTVTISVTDPMGGVRTTQFTLRVVHVPKPLEISGVFPTGTVGRAYAGQIVVTGGEAPYTMSTTCAPPAGLTFNANGTLTGTPLTPSTNVLQVDAVDARGVATSKPFTIVVLAPVRVTPVFSGNNLAFNVSGSGSKTYVLETADRVDAAVWTPISTNSAASGQVTFPALPMSGAAGFFRAREQ